MLELLYKLFIGHAHMYEIIDRKEIHKYRKESDTMPIRMTETITSRCTICGKIVSQQIEK